MRDARYAAIAMTLIIAVPLLLGFALASEDRETEREVVTSTTSLTDYALNSSAPYFMAYTGPQNNGQLIQYAHVSGTGLESSLVNPVYVRTGDNPSSQPIYDLSGTTGATALAAGASWTASPDWTDPLGVEAVSSRVAYRANQADWNPDHWFGIAAMDGMAFTQAQGLQRIQFEQPYTIYSAQRPGYSPWVEVVSGSGGDACIAYTQGSTVYLRDADGDAHTFGGGFRIECRATPTARAYTVTTASEVPASEVGSCCIYTGTRQVAMDGWNPVTYSGEETTCRLYMHNGLLVLEYGGDLAFADPVFGNGFYIIPDDGYAATWSPALEPSGLSYVKTDSSSLGSTGYAWFAGSAPSDGLMICGPADDPAVVQPAVEAVYDSTGWKVNGRFGGSHAAFDGVDGWLYIPSAPASAYTRGWTTIDPRDPEGLQYPIWSFDWNGPASLRVVYLDGGVEYVAYTDLQGVVVSDRTATANGNGSFRTFLQVSSVAVATHGGEQEVQWKAVGQAVSGYAEVAYGWTLPSSDRAWWDVWTNGHANRYVRMTAALDPGEALIFYEAPGQNAGTLLSVSSSPGGMVSVEWPGHDAVRLGTYQYVCIELDAKGQAATVSGMRDWPGMGASPGRVNAAEAPFPSTDGVLSQLVLAAVGTPVLRVDSADIMAGTFSTTKDLVLDLFGLFPEDSVQELKLNSVGVYGDVFSLGGTDYAVEGGRISVDGAEVALNHAVVRWDRTEDGVVATIDGREVPVQNTTVGFGGEWSLVLSRTAYGTEPATATAWVPGVFALDEDGVVLAMLMTAVGVFVALGMSGGRSGSKVGILALVCGGAAAVGLMII